MGSDLNREKQRLEELVKKRKLEIDKLEQELKISSMTNENTDNRIRRRSYTVGEQIFFCVRDVYRYLFNDPYIAHLKKETEELKKKIQSLESRIECVNTKSRSRSKTPGEVMFLCVYKSVRKLFNCVRSRC